MPSCSKICRIRRPCFNIDGCTTLWTVALKQPIFKRKKGFANISLGLNYCSMGSSWPWSRDTVPLNFINKTDFFLIFLLRHLVLSCYLAIMARHCLRVIFISKRSCFTKNVYTKNQQFPGIPLISGSVRYAESLIVLWMDLELILSHLLLISPLKIIYTVLHIKKKQSNSIFFYK
jgi:hypothetical protein